MNSLNCVRCGVYACWSRNRSLSSESINMWWNGRKNDAKNAGMQGCVLCSDCATLIDQSKDNSLICSKCNTFSIWEGGELGMINCEEFVKKYWEERKAAAMTLGLNGVVCESCSNCASSSSQQFCKLMRDGKSIPMIGYGTYLLSSTEVEACCTEAIRMGYNHIDTAEGYHTEESVGKVSCGLPSKPYITTKLWPTINDRMKTFDEVVVSLEVSLEKLQLSCVDLYLIHAPLGDKDTRLIQWQALIHLQAIGKCASIGVSNYSVVHLNEIKEAGLAMPAVNQLELHPLCQHKDIVAYCNNENIVIVAYSSLAPLSSWRVNQRSAKTAADSEPVLLQELADKYQLSKSDVLLLWAIQHGYGILPKSCNVERIQRNFQLVSNDARMSAEDMERLDQLESHTCFAWPAGDPSQHA